MKILLACEESQKVCMAFRAKGHDAYSCDLLPESGGHPEWHIQGDVVPLLQEKWDMIIAFPPCTHLAVSGAAWFAKKIEDGRQQQGIDFFMLFTKADCERVAIENPIGIMSKRFRKPDQIIQPWQFGEPFQKSTCLWLKGLPLLVSTKMVEHGEFKEWVDPKTGKTKRQPMWFFKALSAKTPAERTKIRNTTLQGIADAMADQWGNETNLIQNTPSRLL